MRVTPARVQGRALTLIEVLVVIVSVVILGHIERPYDGTLRYCDMDQAIARTLVLADRMLAGNGAPR